MASGSTITDASIFLAAQNAGFTGNDAVIAVAIALAESGGVPGAVNRANANGSTDFGLWQINSVHAQLLTTGDPLSAVDNAKMAFSLYNGRGQKFTDWVTYNNRRYVMFMGRANAVKDTVGGVVENPQTTSTGLTAVGEAFDTISSPETWKRIALFLAGLALLIILAVRVVGSGLLSATPVGRAARLIK